MNPKPTNGRALVPLMALAALGLAALAPTAPARAQRDAAGQSVRAAATRTGGTITIAWGRPVTATAAAVGNRVVLIFDRPLEASLAGIAGTLPVVVRRVDASADKRAFTIVLQRPHKMRLVRRGRLVIVDLLRPGAAAKAGDRTAPPKPPKPPKSMAKAPPPKAMPKPIPKPAPDPTAKPVPTVGVVYRRTPAFERLTFAWDAPVGYAMDRVGGIVWLKFRKPGRIDMAALRDQLRGAGISVQAKPGSSKLDVFVRAPTDRTVRHYRAGDTVVFEVLARKPAPPRIAKQLKSAPRPKAGKPPARPPARAPMTAKVLPKTPPAGRPEAPSAVKPAAGSPEPRGTGDDPFAMPAISNVSLSSSGGVPTLRFEWPRPVAAAAFRRGRHIWLVFAAPAEVDVAALRAGLKDRVLDLDRVKAPEVTALRIAAGAGTGIAIARDGLTWQVSIQDRPGAAGQAIGIEAQPSAVGGGRLLLKAAHAGRPLVIMDPGVGDVITVVPVTSPGLGVAEARRFAKFRLLATVQGMVVEGAADGVAVRAGTAAVIVTGYRGLNLSGSPLPRKPVRKAPRKDVRLFDFDAWRGGPKSAFPEEFAAEKDRRQRAVSMASRDKRGAARMELARFFFAHGFAADALGVLRRIELTDAKLARTAGFRALRGASRYLIGQLKNAGRDLYDGQLDDAAEIALWRGAVAARAGKWSDANREFLRAGAVIRSYPSELRTKFGELAAEAAIVAGDLRRAKGLVALVRTYDPPQRDVERLDFLDAVIDAKSGRHSQAVTVWSGLARNAVSRQVRVRAAAARIERQLAFGTLDAKAAIEELENARYIWRGDATEYEVNELLGRVYLQDGRTVKGLDALARAGRLYPELAKARRLRARMQRAFLGLFLKRGADKLEPLRALGVFHEFAYLMPAGPDGDRMITALADRLVAVDLLERASRLLDEQIKKRLTGAERAKVGARLALLRLLDKKPAAAIEALRGSDTSSMPAELARQRRRLRARALANIGQTGNALVLLGPDRSHEAELLRADIHWKASNWKEAAAAYGRLAGRIPAEAGALDEVQSRTVLAWAVTLALAGDGPGLKTLRARFGKAMAGGPYRATFQVIANEIEAGVPNYRKIAERVSEVDAYQAFMTVYRKRIAAGGLKAVN